MELLQRGRDNSRGVGGLDDRRTKSRKRIAPENLLYWPCSQSIKKKFPYTGQTFTGTIEHMLANGNVYEKQFSRENNGACRVRISE
jgi:hypothetical protein